MSKNDKAFSNRDVLVIEVESFIDNYVVPNVENSMLPTLLKGNTKTEIEILGSQYFELERDLEEELEAWKAAQRYETKQLEKLKNEILAKEGVNIPDDQLTLTASRFAYLDHKNAPSHFLENVGRPRKPLKSIKIVRNLGPRATDLQALNERKSSLDDLMKEALLELLKEKKEASKKGSDEQ